LTINRFANCGDYMAEYFKTAPGYLQDPTSTTTCGYCEYKYEKIYIKKYKNIKK